MKNKKESESFTYEIGESISFPIESLKEYPKNNVFVVGESIYYVHKLYDRIVINRVTINEY